MIKIWGYDRHQLTVTALFVAIFWRSSISDFLDTHDALGILREFYKIGLILLGEVTQEFWSLKLRFRPMIYFVRSEKLIDKPHTPTT